MRPLQRVRTEGDMDKDPVCGMTVSRGEVADKSEYQGRTYYFCSADCKSRFDVNPLQYAVRRISET
jgi:YHS domain-containing protein